MVKNYPTVKASIETKRFLKKIVANVLIVQNVEIKMQDVLPLLIEKYFKNNNARYIEMISQEIIKK